jgi:hypothetical protein
MKMKCDCFGCRTNEEIRKFGSIAKYYNSLTINEKIKINRDYIEGVIENRELALAQTFIEASRLNILSIEKFNKTISVLNKDEVNELADLLFAPYIHKEIKNYPHEHWGDQMAKTGRQELEGRLEELLEALKKDIG